MSAGENDTVKIHPLTIRITHWLNALAIFIMIGSGWRIYNASPVFGDFTFPRDFTIGGWLAGALQWHFAAMWLLVVNALVYVTYGIVSGHIRRSFFPVGPKSVWRDLGAALRGRLSHDLGMYNAVQRTAYLGVIAVIAVIVASGLAIWKPVQFQDLAALLGGYDNARIVHFLAMCALVLFVVVHLTLVVLVPRTFWPMLSGRAHESHAVEPHGPEA